MKNIDNYVKENLTIKFTYIDLFYAFCKAKGIEDPETGVDSDEEYTALENEFENKIKSRDIFQIAGEIYSVGLKTVEEKMREVEKRTI